MEGSHVTRFSDRIRRRPVLAGFLAALVLTAGCTLPAFAPKAESEGAAAAPGTAPTWRACPEVPDELVGRGATGMRYECARIAVPRNWGTGAAAGATAGPGAGETFEIALIRIRSVKQRDRIGSLVVNPGGPGASGVDTAVYLSFGPGFGGLPTEVTDRFDIVGFDPRGVSRSSPVKCISDAELDASFGYDPDPESQASFDGFVDLNRRIGQQCGTRYGDQLPLYGTEQAARDMDAVRAAVGDEKLTYLGYSYGTLLGATYAQLYPQRVRALVLDGAVDPRQRLLAGSESQAKGFERAFDNFARWCTANAGRCPIAPDARAAVTTAIDKARVSPVRGRDGREATAGWVFYAVISSLYTEQGWQELARSIDALQGGDPTGVFKLADAYAERGDDGHYSNMFDANMAVNCTDETEKPTREQIRSVQSQWRQKYPLFGPALAVGMLGCVEWPGGRDAYPTGKAAGAPPILVVGTTGDPATPYEQTPALASMLGVGRVLTWEGEGHTAYPQTACVTRAVDAYLLSLTVPREGLRCPAR
ncbi:alpha/beta fold hydrolase [Micromonospora terminaliae]|uniref:Alpha/beta fold hydrolase n=1 Tax=Micromonospora terminaliae TaxID=1914461 RepID=A0AAJ2ZFE2_9ACTN|nr:alpha/beta hydrolase [Micromonospora terminaliae]NES28254.1 alpha/beta hydrolase [Micromonospora terminaliae]QGL46006.1 alpha/beta fold hydrolase [Micromonospora terminaliae]